MVTKEEVACWLDNWQKRKEMNSNWEHQSATIIKRWKQLNYEADNNTSISSQSESRSKISSEQRKNGLHIEKVGRVGEPSSWRIWLLCRGRKGRKKNMGRKL